MAAIHLSITCWSAGPRSAGALSFHHDHTSARLFSSIMSEAAAVKSLESRADGQCESVSVVFKRIALRSTHSVHASELLLLLPYALMYLDILACEKCRE